MEDKIRDKLGSDLTVEIFPNIIADFIAARDDYEKAINGPDLDYKPVVTAQFIRKLAVWMGSLTRYDVVTLNDVFPDICTLIILAVGHTPNNAIVNIIKEIEDKKIDSDKQ